MAARQQNLCACVHDLEYPQFPREAPPLRSLGNLISLSFHSFSTFPATSVYTKHRISGFWGAVKAITVVEILHVAHSIRLL